MTALDGLSTEAVVYVVDDDEAARDSLCALVSSMGLTARGFVSADAFLGNCDANPIGCLVTDYRMVGLSGLELQRQLNARGIKLPVIMITAYATPALAVQTMQQGAVTLLEKPCDDQILAEAIREALDSRRAAASRRRRATRQRQPDRHVVAQGALRNGDDDCRQVQ